jgi:DNA-binding CsgD family transcriptional regulator
MSAAVPGRGDELERLLGLVRAVVAGHGAVVLIEGEPGIGKTTLLDAMADEAGRSGVRVRRCAGEDETSPVPFATIGRCLGLPPSGGEPEFVITETILGRVDRWAAAGPVLLMIDDLHRVDPASLVALSRLGRAVDRLPLLIVAAHRPMGRNTLLAALDTAGTVPVTLGPLPAHEVAGLVERLVGVPPAAGLLELVAAAGGNPRYIGELVGTLTAAGRLRVVDGTATVIEGPGLPRPLAEAVLRRLDLLSGHAREVLRAAAVLPPRFTVTELSTVVGTPVIALWEAVNEALAAGLLVGADTELAIRHELVRQALAEELPVEVRRSLRRRTAKALASAGAPVERVAEQLLADGILDAELADWLARVAEPLTARAPGLAAELLDRAVDRGLLPAARPQLARALLWAGRPADAEAAVRSATGAQARYLLAYACLQQGDLERAIAEAERALAEPGVPDPDRGLLNGLLGLCLLLLGRVAAADAAATRASPAHRACLTAAVRLAQRRPEEALALTESWAGTRVGPARRRSTATEPPDLPAAPHLVRGLCLLALDRLAEADEAFAAGLRESGPGAFQAWYHLGRVRIRYLDGRWDEALAGIQAGLRSIDPFGAAGALRSQAAVIAMHRGDFRSYADVVGAPDTSVAGRYWGFLRVRSVDDELRPLRGTDDANRLLAAAREHGRAGRPLYEGYTYELAAVLLARKRRPRDAHSALDAALDRYRRLGATWDAERATGRLRRAGLRRRRERQRTGIGWSSLTETERRIATLVAAGRSSADIAAELFLSPRTVQGNVSRILAKLGLSSRIELVATVIGRDGSQPPSP